MQSHTRFAFTEFHSAISMLYSYTIYNERELIIQNTTQTLQKTDPTYNAIYVQK